MTTEYKLDALILMKIMCIYVWLMAMIIPGLSIYLRRKQRHSQSKPGTLTDVKFTRGVFRTKGNCFPDNESSSKANTHTNPNCISDKSSQCY